MINRAKNWVKCCFIRSWTVRISRTGHFYEPSHWRNFVQQNFYFFHLYDNFIVFCNIASPNEQAITQRSVVNCTLVSISFWTGAWDCVLPQNSFEMDVLHAELRNYFPVVTWALNTSNNCSPILERHIPNRHNYVDRLWKFANLLTKRKSNLNECVLFFFCCFFLAKTRIKNSEHLNPSPLIFLLMRSQSLFKSETFTHQTFRPTITKK